MVTNKHGLDIIKRFEGLHLKAYKCPAGVWTIGWGHTKTAAEGQMITEDEARFLLLGDLAHFETGVTTSLGGRPTAENQFSAMVSFAFNLGLGALGRSRLLKKHKAGDYAGAAEEFGKWVFAGGRKLRGLERRRAAEADLYLTEDGKPWQVPD